MRLAGLPGAIGDDDAGLALVDAKLLRKGRREVGDGGAGQRLVALQLGQVARRVLRHFGQHDLDLLGLAVAQHLEGRALADVMGIDAELERRGSKMG